MKIQTFSVIVGDTSCNANCPFCVSKMTPECGVDETEVMNIRNFHKSCQFAKDSGVSTVLLTGKGEPLLKKNMGILFTYLNQLDNYRFPFVEVQTNATKIMDMSDSDLQHMYDLGVTTFIISCVHYEQERNKEIYNKMYPDLEELVKYLHEKGFSVRLSCVMLDGYIGDLDSLLNFIARCRQWGVEQFTARPVTNAIKFDDVRQIRDDNDPKKVMFWWTEKHEVKDSKLNKIVEHFRFPPAVALLKLMHGATVYDYCGQNVCLSNCLTESTSTDEVRQIIFFPDGHLRFSWNYPGAIIF